MTIKDGIKAGDTFNAFIKKGLFSKRIDGREGAGQLACGCPDVAEKVDNLIIHTKTSHYFRTMFTFEKV